MRLAGRPIVARDAPRPWRYAGPAELDALVGQRLACVTRIGKFISLLERDWAWSADADRPVPAGRPGVSSPVEDGAVLSFGTVGPRRMPP
jgi:hypothetical protein